MLLVVSPAYSSKAKDLVLLLYTLPSQKLLGRGHHRMWRQRTAYYRVLLIGFIEGKEDEEVENVFFTISHSLCSRITFPISASAVTIGLLILVLLILIIVFKT